MTANSGPPPVRRLMFSGTWYDRDPAVLSPSGRRVAVDGRAARGRVCGLVAPHAGLRYSGRIAAWSYEPLSGLALDAVVLDWPLTLRRVSRMRHAAPRQSGHPVGRLAGPRGACRRARRRDARACPRAPRDPRSRARARTASAAAGPRPPGVAVVPILVGEHSRAVADALGDALARASAGRRVVYAASSDLSHFHPRADAAGSTTGVARLRPVR